MLLYQRGFIDGISPTGRRIRNFAEQALSSLPADTDTNEMDNSGGKYDISRSKDPEQLTQRNPKPSPWTIYSNYVKIKSPD